MTNSAVLGLEVFSHFYIYFKHTHNVALPAKCSWAEQINLQWLQEKKNNKETGIT